MPSFNKVILMGNVTRDPDTRTIPSTNTTVTNTALAVNYRFKEKEEVMFIDIAIYGKQAETIAMYVKKGTPLLVEGRLSQRTWEKDGQKFSRHEVIVENFRFIGKRDNDEGYSSDDVNQGYNNNYRGGYNNNYNNNYQPMNNNYNQGGYGANNYQQGFNQPQGFNNNNFAPRSNYNYNNQGMNQQPYGNNMPNNNMSQGGQTSIFDAPNSSDDMPNEYYNPNTANKQQASNEGTQKEGTFKDEDLPF